MMFEDAEGDVHEPAHHHAESGLLGLTGVDEALIQGLGVGVVFGGHECGQVQLGAQPGRTDLGQARRLVYARARLGLDRNQAQIGRHL